MGGALLQVVEGRPSQALVRGPVKVPGEGWERAGWQVRGPEWKGVLPGGPGIEGQGQGRDRRPGWDGEVEEAQGWGKAEPPSGGAEGPERGLGKAGHAQGGVAVRGHQAEGQRSKESVQAQVLEPGGGRGVVDAGGEGAVEGAAVQMLLGWEEAEVGAQSLGQGNQRGSQEKSAGLGGSGGAVWLLMGRRHRVQGVVVVGALGSRAGEEQALDLVEVPCG